MVYMVHLKYIYNIYIHNGTYIMVYIYIHGMYIMVHAYVKHSPIYIKKIITE